MSDFQESVNNTILSYCRFCVKQGNYQELLDLSCDEKTLTEFIKLVQYLKMDFLNLSLSNNLPKTTCAKCYDLFQEAYRFFKRFCDSQDILKAMNDVFLTEHDVSLSSAPNEYYSEHYIDSAQVIQDVIAKELAQKQFVTQSKHCCFCAKQNEDITHLLQNDISEEYPRIVKFFKITCLLTLTMFPNCCQLCYGLLQHLYNFFQTVKLNQPILCNLYNVKKEPDVAVSVKVEPDITENIELKANPLNFCAVSINSNPSSDLSWNNYPWKCIHCKVNFETAGDVRSHSKEKHNVCFAFSCADCDATFVTHNEFIDHVRQHRDILRLYCQYCNAQFITTEDCVEHVNTHYVGTEKICDICGEMLPYANTLLWHKQLYGKIASVEGIDCEGRSWADYRWTCQACSLSLPDVASLRAHTQRAHDKCFSMKCADCPKFMKNYKVFVPHATAHRPYLRNYCQYCNEHFDNETALSQHIVKHITSQQRPCSECGLIFKDNTQLARHKRTFSPKHLSKRNKTIESKRKKRITKTTNQKRRIQKVALTSEDLTCNICGKLYQSLLTLTRHVKTHDVTRPRDFVCQTCGRAFLTKNTMTEHAKTHSVKTEICQVCNKEFHTKHKLKAHIVTHSELRPFVCDECGNSFKTKKRLKCHLKSHSTIKPYKCLYCYKEFKFKENLKTHEYQHTGVRPYSCEICDRTFTNWANCNKHMIRKHGVSLARTKITSQGRVAINRRTGEVTKLATDKTTKDWLTEMMKPERPSKRGQ